MPKTWLITGAAGGLGAQIAAEALAAGDNVVATDRDLDRLQASFPKPGPALLLARLDVQDPAQAQAAAQAARARFGRIDVLVNNAGYGQFGPFEQNSVAQIDQQFAVNLFGVMHMTRAVLPILREQRAGYIINMSSNGGLVGVAGGSLYSASKFALEGFSEALALEVAQFGVKLTLVEPGAFRTDFLAGGAIRYGDIAIADYDAFAQERKASNDGRSHQQRGDPRKLAQALLVLVDEPNPPLRFVAGADATEKVTAKLQGMAQEIQRWSALSTSTDVDD
jgi:NAD(P)-dependent dehydrogenase (short-subunit alcohol dehydrogenase family)